MDILDSLLTAVRAKKYEHSFVDVQLRHILEPDNNMWLMLVDTPLSRLSLTNVDFSDMSTLNLIVMHILRNTVNLRVETFPALWEKFFLCIYGAAHHKQLEGRNALLSLLLQIAGPHFNTFLSIAVAAEFAGAMEVSPFLQKFLTCPTVEHAHRMATPNGFPDDYSCVPTVFLITNINSHLHGYACMNDSVAVNVLDANTDNSPSKLLSLANLIAHEVQHCIVREVNDDFVVSTATERPAETVLGAAVAAAEEAGERFERLLWFGQLVQWWRPLSAVEGNNVAKAIIKHILATGDMPVFTEENKTYIDSWVGFRTREWRQPPIASLFYQEERYYC